MNTITTFIDRQYYNDNYKPELNARISGNYNKVAEHSANFDSFALRGSELVNRLTHNEIYNLGGLDYCSPKAQEWLKKATASLVEYWYLNDYKLGDIQLAFSMGGISLNRVKHNETLRKFIPETTLSYVQSSGLGKQSVAFLNTGDRGQQVNGLNSNDFYTKDMANVIFNKAGQYDANFHTSIDLTPEQAGTTGERYYAIAKEENITGNGDISFTLLGGNQAGNGQVKYFVSLVYVNGVYDATTSGVSVINPNADDQLAPLEFLMVQDGTTIIMYIKSFDDALDVLITDITPDTNALFDLFGSSITTPIGALILNLLTYMTTGTNVDQLEDRVAQNETDIAQLEADTTDLPTMRTDIATNTANITQNTTDIQNVKGTADSALAEADQNKADISVNTANINKKLDTDYAVSENGKIPQVENGKLVLVNATSLQPDTSQIQGIGVDDNVLTTTNKRYNTAINELDREGVKYQNDGANFKLDGDNDTNYDLRQIEVNEQGVKDVNESLDNIMSSSANVSIPVTTAIPFTVAGDTLTADVSGLDFSKVGISFDVFAKVEDTTTGSSEIIRESYNNNAVTDVKFFSDDSATAELTDTTFIIDNVSAGERNNKQITSMEYRVQGSVSVDVSNKANTNLDNVTDNTFLTKGNASGLATKIMVQTTDVNVATNTTDIATNKADIATNKTEIANGATMTNMNTASISNNKADIEEITNDGKIKSDSGTREITIPNKVGTILLDDAIQIFKGQVLSFNEQKTTGAFADRTIFSETLIKDGYAIVGGTGGAETTGEIKSHTHGLAIYNSANADAAKAGAADGTPFQGNQTTTPTGGAANKAAGYALIKYVYTAVKDITYAEMSA